MSKKIDQIIKVVQKVSQQHSECPTQSIKSLRIEAIKSVADRHGIRSTTVSDKFRRWLQPEIKGTASFDRLLEEWLLDGTNELEMLLRNQCSEDDLKAIEAIDRIFEVTTEIEGLAAEFGYEPQDEKFKEGKAILKLHLVKERNQKLIKKAKKIWKEQTGRTVCMICNFSFLECYGAIGADYIEAHHKLPVSLLTEETEVGVEDLAAVCSNCHRMLHWQRPGPSIEELQAVILKHKHL